MSFLTDNIKLILHLRQRLHSDNMLGLCLGAGMSADFSFPTKRISEREEIQGNRLLEVSQSLTSQAQFLFQKYKQSLGPTGDEVVDHRQAAVGWLDIVHMCLYNGAKTDDEDLRSHPYGYRLTCGSAWTEKN